MAPGIHQSKSGRPIPGGLIAAPMAGVTHSALRRLVATFGGYDALSTEMLSTRALAREDVLCSPYTKRRPEEGQVVYQLLTTEPGSTAEALERLAPLEPFAVDINLGCPAPEVCKQGGGTALFHDISRLEKVLDAARRAWDGPLTVKCRLGRNVPTWREDLLERFTVFEAHGVDAVTLHPRFADEKLKRRARWEVFEWLCDQTAMPLIGNGDICSADQVTALRARFPGLAGIMVGRIVAAQPWFFTLVHNSSLALDHAAIWEQCYGYILDDFPPERAIGRLKEFTAYYATNFLFGHDLFRAAQGAPDIRTLRERALAFLERKPGTVRAPSFGGL